MCFGRILLIYIYNYIYITGQLQPLSQAPTDLKTTLNDRFFEILFMSIFLFYSQSFCQKSAERLGLGLG